MLCVACRPQAEFPLTTDEVALYKNIVSISETSPPSKHNLVRTAKIALERHKDALAHSEAVMHARAAPARSVPRVTIVQAPHVDLQAPRRPLILWLRVM